MNSSSPVARRACLALLLASFLAPVLAGCSSDDAFHRADAGPGDATATVIDAADGGSADGSQDSARSADAGDVPDATLATDATDATDALDALDAADASYPSDWPPLTRQEACRVVWPQPAGYSGAGDDVQLVTDATGNTYVALTYYSVPPVDLGVASPGYAMGLAVAKVDPQCHVVWMREFGGSGTATETPEIVARIAVDATSSVTIAGSFNGPIDFGQGPVHGYQVGFVMRLDAAGHTVFDHEYPLVFPGTVGVKADGTAAILFFDYGAMECSLNHGLCDGGTPPDAGLEFYSLAFIDATGVEISRNHFPGSPAVTGLAPATFSDLALDPAGTIWGIDNATDGGPSVQLLTQAGSLLWSHLAGGYALTLGPAGGLVYGMSSSAPGASEKFELYAPDGGLSWKTTLKLATGYPSEADMGIDSTGAIYAAGSIALPDRPMGVEVLDPQGRPQSVRAAVIPGDSYYRTSAVTPGGTAVIAGDVYDADGGLSYFLVELGP
jgi:hypothetical protein